MAAEDAGAPFPLRACLHVALGFLLSAAAFHLWPHDPCAALRHGIGLADPLALHPELRSPKTPGETRILFAGASLTAGFPYGLAASFASTTEAGLRAVFPDRRILVKAVGKPALDSAGIADVVDAALAAEPDAVWVVLGDSEIAARLFAERDLVPRGWLGRVSDHATRSRGPVLAFARRSTPAAGPWVEDPLPFLKRLPGARAAQPMVEALPVPPADREVLAERMRASLRRMAHAAAARGVPLVLLQSPYDLAGAWPCGMTEPAGDLDAAVLALRRGATVERAQAEELVRRHPERADAHTLLGRVLLAAGDGEAARRELLRARDLDPAPLHVIDEVERALRDEGAALGLPVLDLDAGTFLAGASVPDPACFLDPGHWSLAGTSRGAAHVAQLLAEQGAIPALPAGWRGTFEAAARAHLERVVDPEAGARGAAHAWRSSGLIHVVLGNARDGVFPLADGAAWYAGALAAPEDPAWVEWALQVVRCAAMAADRSAELSAGTPDARTARMAGLVRRLWLDARAGRPRALVWAILDGEDLDGLAKQAR